MNDTNQEPEVSETMWRDSLAKRKEPGARRSAPGTEKLPRQLDLEVPKTAAKSYVADVPLPPGEWERPHEWEQLDRASKQYQPGSMHYKRDFPARWIMRQPDGWIEVEIISLRSGVSYQPGPFVIVELPSGGRMEIAALEPLRYAGVKR